ncbi:MAG: hypothetical protein KHX05_09600 [Firmicutes bacterium]|nr:hypothetical protein [Bacillota bacterium]
MDAPQSFRSAFNGFNRQDVVHYLEYINTKHQTQVNELTAEADDLRRQLEDLQAKTTQVAELEAQLAAMTEERDALHTQLEQIQAAEVVQEPRPEMDGGSQVADELDSYRRAQQVERSARERAELVYHQANGVLNEAIAKVDTATAEITAKTDEAMSQLTQLQMAVSTSKQALQDAASLMNTIRPNY